MNKLIGEMAVFCLLIVALTAMAKEGGRGPTDQYFSGKDRISMTALTIGAQESECDIEDQCCPGLECVIEVNGAFVEWSGQKFGIEWECEDYSNGKQICSGALIICHSSDPTSYLKIRTLKEELERLEVEFFLAQADYRKAFQRAEEKFNEALNLKEIYQEKEIILITALRQ